MYFKFFLTQFISTLSSACVDPERRQPTSGEIMDGILNFQGPVITYRGFKQARPYRLRSLTETEFQNAADTLAETSYGTSLKIRVPRSVGKTAVFVKSSPEEIFQNKENMGINVEDYERKYQMKLHSSVSCSLKRILVERNLIEDVEYSQQ